MFTQRHLPNSFISAFSTLDAKFFLMVLVLASFLLLSDTGTRTQAATLTVSAGGDVQQALNAAQPGDTIELAAGASFIGPFILPVKSGAAYITVQSSQLSALPGAQGRVTPAHASLMPKLLSTGGGQSVLRTAAGAHHFRFIGIEFAPTDASAFIYQVVALGNTGTSQDTLDEVPHHLIFDRCYIHAHPGQDLRRGIMLNSAHTEIINCYIADFKSRGADSQAIAGWNGPGPFKIINNYLEGAGENIMFGGADPSIPNLVPSDIEIRRNLLAKPLQWRAENWSVKNLFELKNARRVHVEGNVMENNWGHSQSGEAVLFTVRNQDGTAPWSVVEDVTFINNIVRHSGGGINVLGVDYYQPSQQTKRIKIANNLFDDIDGNRWNGKGEFLLITERAGEMMVDHNTVRQSGSIIIAASGPHTPLTFTNNIVSHNQYGIHGDGTGQGTPTLDRYFPGSLVRRNALIGGLAKNYPADNFFPALAQDIGFVDLAGGNYRLRANSTYHAGGSDGKDLGCDFDALNAAIAGPPAPTPAPTAGSLVWQAHTTAVTLAAQTSYTEAPLLALVAEIEQARAVFTTESSRYPSAEQIDVGLLVAIYFARAAAALSAANAPAAAVQKRLQISAARLRLVYDLMGPTGGRSAASALGGSGTASASAGDIGMVEMKSRASLAPVLAPGSFGMVVSTSRQSPLAPRESSAVPAADDSLPLELDGVSVTVGGVAASLVYVSASRIDFPVPSGVPAGEVEVLVTSLEGFVSYGKMTVAAFAPGLFTVGGHGTGEAVVLNAADYTTGSFNSLTPASLSSDQRTRLMIFATGIRAAVNSDTSNDVRHADGRVSANLAESIVVEARTTDGRAFTLPVEYAGAHGPFAGIDQITVQLIPELQGAGQVALTIITGGQVSNKATVTVL